jgi:uncharacterized protein YkwD
MNVGAALHRRLSVRVSQRALALVALPALVLVVQQMRGLANEKERQIIYWINYERDQHDLAALRINYALMNAARDHNSLMAQREDLSHQLSGEPNLGSRTRSAGYDWLGVAENIAAGHPSPEIAVRGMSCATARCFTPCMEGRCNGWMQSSGHRRNILDASMEDIGVGYVDDETTQLRYWYTANFGRHKQNVPTVTPPAAVECNLPEDVNSDRIVDRRDVNEVAAAWHRSSEDDDWGQYARYDVIRDGNINVIDVVSVIRHLFEFCP